MLGGPQALRDWQVYEDQAILLCDVLLCPGERAPAPRAAHFRRVVARQEPRQRAGLRGAGGPQAWSRTPGILEGGNMDASSGLFRVF